MKEIQEAVKELVFLLDISSEEHCQESKDAILQCKSIADLASVLNQFATQIKRKEVRLYYFINKWFSQNKEELNRYNIYIDQEVNLSNVDTSKCLFILGNSDVYLFADKSNVIDVQLFDYSKMTVYAQECSLVKVVLHHKTKCRYEIKDMSKVIIKKYK